MHNPYFLSEHMTFAYNLQDLDIKFYTILILNLNSIPVVQKSYIFN